MARCDIDQFYTLPDLAAKYVAGLVNHRRNCGALYIEPSAGSGAFLDALRRCGCKVRAMDIAPGAAGIMQGDFLQSDSLFKGQFPRIAVGGNRSILASAAHGEGQFPRVVVVGNPPFGKNAALAVKFFNRAAIWADEIAFIVPRSFRKISVQGRLNRHFHLFSDEDVPVNAFLLDGCPHDVPCAWQTWQRQDGLRQRPKIPSVSHLIDYVSPRQADFAMRRVGFYAGRVVTKNIPALSQTTHYFMREMRAGVAHLLSSIDWRDIAAQTAGVRSLSKREIALRLSEACRA